MNRWIKIAKTSIIISLILFGVYIMLLVGWEVIGHADNKQVSIALIAAFTSITGILGVVLKTLLHHERENKKDNLPEK